MVALGRSGKSVCKSSRMVLSFVAEPCADTTIGSKPNSKDSSSSPSPSSWPADSSTQSSQLHDGLWDSSERLRVHMPHNVAIVFIVARDHWRIYAGVEECLLCCVCLAGGTGHIRASRRCQHRFGKGPGSNARYRRIFQGHPLCRSSCGRTSLACSATDEAVVRCDAGNLLFR